MRNSIVWVLICMMLLIGLFACRSSTSSNDNGDTSGFTGDFLSWTGSDDTSHTFELVRVNGQTGTVTTIGGTNYFTGLAYGPDGRLYGVRDELHIINPTNGDTTLIGNLSLNSGTKILMNEASFAPDGRLFVIESSGDRVFTVNLTTGALTLVGTVASGVFANGLEFSASGTLYTSFAFLYTLNASNVSESSTLGSTGILITQLTFGRGGILYGMDIFPSTNIYSLNLSTGLASVVTSVTSTGLESLVAERTTTVYPAPKVQTAVVNTPTISSHDIESLLTMENEIKNHYLMSK